MLEIKHNIKLQQWQMAHEVAENWINTVDPEESYCYYALAMACPNPKAGLTWCKKVGTRTASPLKRRNSIPLTGPKDEACRVRQAVLTLLRHELRRLLGYGLTVYACFLLLSCVHPWPDFLP